MNDRNLHAIIEQYENDFENVYGEKKELFKWRALKAWQDAFHSAESNGNFREKFSAAKKAFSIRVDSTQYSLVDSRNNHPSTGIVKLWEKEPEKMEYLFQKVLLKDPCGDAARAESQMTEFLNEFEILRCQHFPEAGSYKVTPHSASVFMTLDNPSFNYIFRIKIARRMANYIGFNDDLGSGTKPNLANYYRMCDRILSAMKEHENLFRKHASYLADDMMDDPEHHMMVFDLMHCSGYRHYYTNLIPMNIGKSKTGKARKGSTPEELEREEREKLQKMKTIQEEIDNLESSIEGCEEISLMDVEVTHPKLGTGTVISQELKKIKRDKTQVKITVRFPNEDKVFYLNREYSNLLTFKNVKDIVEALTVYGETIDMIEAKKKELERLQGK